jgi:hypothetical protein
MKIGLICAVALGALVLSTSASAQAPSPSATPSPSPTTTVTKEYTEQRTVGGDQVVSFPGDELPGDVNSAYGFTIRRPPGVLRANLIRPRVNFVSEVLKSVENL